MRVLASFSCLRDILRHLWHATVYGPRDGGGTLRSSLKTKAGRREGRRVRIRRIVSRFYDRFETSRFEKCRPSPGENCYKKTHKCRRRVGRAARTYELMGKRAYCRQLVPCERAIRINCVFQLPSARGGAREESLFPPRRELIRNLTYRIFRFCVTHKRDTSPGTGFHAVASFPVWEIRKRFSAAGEFRSPGTGFRLFIPFAENQSIARA